MRIVLVLDDGTEVEAVEEPSPTSAPFPCACPACKPSKPPSPVRVAGRGKRANLDLNAYECDAVCIKCGAKIGLVRAFPSTIFGIDEDQRVLAGRCRVY